MLKQKYMPSSKFLYFLPLAELHAIDVMTSFLAHNVVRCRLAEKMSVYFIPQSLNKLRDISLSEDTYFKAIQVIDYERIMIMI